MIKIVRIDSADPDFLVLVKKLDAELAIREEKLERNIKKDANNIKALKKESWKVYVIWECDIEKQVEIGI